jgi:hypothetical protein
MHGSKAEPVGPPRTTLALDADEVPLLQAMLHEAITNDLDLLEDVTYAGEDGGDVIARIALAIRLDVALG